MPLSKRRGVSVEPVLLRRNGSGSSGRSNESKQPAMKLTTPTISFGDKITGLKEAGTIKLFGQNKKRSVTSAERTPEAETPKPVASGLTGTEDESKNSLQVNPVPQRKNSSDALRTAVLQSKAAIKKGLKIGSTSLSGLRRQPQSSNPDMEQMTSEKVEP